MNFILANCRIGQKQMGVEKSPTIIYNRLLNYHNKFNKHINLNNKVSINEYSFEVNKGYTNIYNKYNEYTKINNYPIITLGGDHSVSLASCQAFIDKYKEDSHIIWIDAHTDINTYESSESKNLHGMPVACLMGLMDSPIINKQYNLKPEQITYLGPRSVDEEEMKSIKENNITLYSSYDIRNNLTNILKEVQENIKDKIIHISFDIDVLDPTFAKSTGTTVVNGLTVSDIYMILNNITKNNLIASCDFVEYNPELGNIKEKERTLNYMELSINTVIKNI